ncbi:unnamed protein product [Adineta steineri]|uniref:Uncharacterized protein n=1 Tax=Adineta steineri TaxID=433720 RepID=A0A815RNV8_9BILA|nr:unnamed protein product [Adineta steineri]
MPPKKSTTQKKRTTTNDTNSDEDKHVVLKDVSSHLHLIINYKNIVKGQTGKIDMGKEVTYIGLNRTRGRGIVLGIGTEEDCNNLLRVLEANNVSKSGDDAEPALVIDESQGDSDEECGSEEFEVQEIDETDDINKTTRPHSSTRDTDNSSLNKSSSKNNKRPLSSTNKSSDNDENLSPTKRSKSDDDDGTYAYLRGRVATLTAENKKLKDKIIEMETSWMRKLIQFTYTFEDLLFIVDIAVILIMIDFLFLARPDPGTIEYFSTVVEICTGGRNDNDRKADKLEQIMSVLAVTEDELENQLDKKSVRNTCRKIVRLLFSTQLKDPDISFNELNKKYKTKIAAIRDYGRLMLPIEGSQFTDGELNNAMASDFYQRDRNLRLSGGVNNNENDAEDN